MYFFKFIVFTFRCFYYVKIQIIENEINNKIKTMLYLIFGINSVYAISLYNVNMQILTFQPVFMK